MKKTLSFVLALVMTIGILAGGTAVKAETTADAQKPFVYVLSSDLDGTNFFGAPDGPNNLCWGLCGGVLIYDNDVTGEKEPGLLDKWECSEDGLTWTFHIQDSACWHDGVPVTADDVVFSYKWFTENTEEFPFENIWWIYCGFDSVDKVDDKTFTVTLPEPSGAALDQFCNQYTEVIPAHIWEGTNRADFCTGENAFCPVGAGPYIMEEYVIGQYLKFRANENYHLGAPAIKDITILIMPDHNSTVVALQAGEIHMSGVTTAEYARLKDDPNLYGELQQAYASRHISINGLEGPLTSKNLRQALNYLCDCDLMCETFYDGCAFPVYGEFPFGVKYQNKDVWVDYTYNVEKAKELIEADGYTMGSDGYYQKDGKTLEFDLLYNSGSAAHTNFALLFVETAAEGGVLINLNGMESSLMSEKYRNNEFDLAMSSYALMVDPSSFEANHIFCRSTNPELIDELWHKGVSLPDGPERQAVYEEIDRIISEEAPWIFGIQNLAPYMINSDLDISEAYLSASYDIIHWEKLRWK